MRPDLVTPSDYSRIYSLSPFYPSEGAQHWWDVARFVPSKNLRAEREWLFLFGLVEYQGVGHTFVYPLNNLSVLSQSYICV